jgi:hypothetical protein
MEKLTRLSFPPRLQGSIIPATVRIVIPALETLS